MIDAAARAVARNILWARRRIAGGRGLPTTSRRGSGERQAAMANKPVGYAIGRERHPAAPLARGWRISFSPAAPNAPASGWRARTRQRVLAGCGGPLPAAAGVAARLDRNRCPSLNRGDRQTD